MKLGLARKKPHCRAYPVMICSYFLSFFLSVFTASQAFDLSLVADCASFNLDMFFCNAFSISILESLTFTQTHLRSCFPIDDAFLPVSISARLTAPETADQMIHGSTVDPTSFKVFHA